MNIYRPYEALADMPDCLHLKETDTRERWHFLFFRIFPIFLLLMVWLIIQQVGTKIPMGWNYTLIAVVLFATAVLFFRSYTTEIKITAGEIYLLRKTVSGPREVTIPLSDVEAVVLKRRKGKVRGAFFYLHTKTKHTYSLLSIPGIYTDEHHIFILKERLEQLLHVTITGK